ncbi:PREDICTED: heat shock 70 kDa protein-like, partial [Rhagoletis zephyria]|uniref:heat shock 70 kDa protein-like n=1 Tax=Rhagoletis zephyria TaxID=28612 RepID=UPI00081122A7
RLVDHFAQQFNRVNNRDMTTNRRALRRLRTACEQAKRALSAATWATVEVDALFEGIDFSAKITRARFEELCSDLFASTLEPVGRALADAKLEKSQIQEIILVGGSTRIPKVQKLLQDFFNGKELNRSINPDEAVAYGAAVQAAILGGGVGDASSPLELTDILLVDVTPLSLGITVKGDLMANIIPRNSAIPARMTKPFATCFDNQTAICIKVLEGERAQMKDNHLLGEFRVEGIPRAPRKEGKVDVTFFLDANGLLEVTATVKSNNKQRSMLINNSDRSRLSAEQIERMMGEARRFKAEDDRQRERVKAFNGLEDYAYELKGALEGVAGAAAAAAVAAGARLSAKERGDALQAVAQTLAWLGRNSLADKEEIDYERDQLEAACKTAMVKLGRR